ncbi:hypothetical protein B0H12DRAFT_1329801 [Mycena haematopus]|nr:hypothetical protein B0H12DRAFT_1329801 [Mycena haematopus]
MPSDMLGNRPASDAPGSSNARRERLAHGAPGNALVETTAGAAEARPATTKPALECTSPDSRATTELYRRLIAEFVDDIQSPIDLIPPLLPPLQRFCGANTVNALASVGSTAARGGMYTSGLQGCAVRQRRMTAPRPPRAFSSSTAVPHCAPVPFRSHLADTPFIYIRKPQNAWLHTASPTGGFPAPTSGHQHSHPLCHPALAPAPVIALAPHAALPHPQAAIPYSRGPHSQPAPARYASAPHDTRNCGDPPELFGLDYSTLARNSSAIEDDKIGLSANVSTNAAVRPCRLRVVLADSLRPRRFQRRLLRIPSHSYPYASVMAYHRASRPRLALTLCTPAPAALHHRSTHLRAIEDGHTSDSPAQLQERIALHIFPRLGPRLDED